PPRGAGNWKKALEPETPGQGLVELVRRGRPGKQSASRAQQLGVAQPIARAPDGAHRRDVEGLPADLLGAALDDARVRELRIADNGAQEGRTLAPRLEEAHRQVRPHDPDGQSGKPGARADIDNSCTMSN